VTETLGQDNMADWLALHGVTAGDCLALLDGHDLATVTVTTLPRMLLLGMSAMEAWGLVAEAVASLLPEAASRVTQEVRVCFDPPLARAFTLHDGGNGVPLVACVWSGRVRDLLTMAHEFGHAAQLISCPPEAVLAPVLREACAFIAEAALVGHLERSKAAQGLLPAVRALWATDTGRFLGRHAQPLRQDLACPDTPYDYSWNYPIARAVAIMILQQDNDAIPALFEGRLSLKQVLVRIGGTTG
jgi:hypothetical protein